MEKPGWFDDSAVKVENGWMVEAEIGEKIRREWSFEDGGRRIEFRSKEGQLLSVWKFFENGDGSLDFETRIGELSRYETKNPFVADIFPEFPSKKIEMIRFQMLDIDVEAETFSIGEVLYFDKKDRCVTAELEVRDEPRWYTHPEESSGQSTKESGTWVSKFENGAEKLRVVVIEDEVVEVVHKSEGGELLFERKVKPSVSVVVSDGEAKLEFLTTPDRHTVRLTVSGEVSEKHVNFASVTTASEFVEGFETLFEPLDDLSFDVTPIVDQFYIDSCEVERFEDVFAASDFAHNGGGDTLLVIEEKGDHFGNVFANYHDEGLYALEMLDEFDFDSEDKDEMIEELPFIQNLVASTIGEAFSKLDLEAGPDFDLTEMTKIS